MGYYTHYSFRVPDSEVTVDQEHTYMEELAKITGYSYPELWEAPLKWYDHSDHMRQLSLRHPSVLFELHGEGEDPLDVWTGWAQNGMYYERPIKVIEPEFDPELFT
jgi:hypothetical protein